MKRTAYVAAATALCAFFSRTSLGAEQVRVLPERTDNAALDYLLAAAELESPANEAEVAARKFIDEELFKLPAKVLETKPAVVALLDREEEMLTKSLHWGAEKPGCQFDVDWAQGPNVLLPHLAVIRPMARHACGVAMLQEINGKPEQAAQIYCDVAQLGAHLCETPEMIGGLVGMQIQNLAFSRMEGFLAAEPRQEAIRRLATGLSRLPQRAFPLDRCLLAESEVFGDWILKNPDSLHNVPGFEVLEPGALRLETVLAGARYYQEQLSRLAKIANGPYYEHGAALKLEMDNLLNNKIDVRKEEDRIRVILMVLLPPIIHLPAEITRNEARLGMMRLLAAAALCKAETNKSPDNLSGLARYFPGGMPRDPFTGSDFIYTLNEGLPRIECNPPEDIRKGESSNGKDPFSFDLGRRRKQDLEALRKSQEKPSVQEK